LTALSRQARCVSLPRADRKRVMKHVIRIPLLLRTFSRDAAWAATGPASRFGGAVSYGTSHDTPRGMISPGE
jgi:hypothetical protein